MTPAEEYRERAIEFFDLAAKSADPEEREALRTFALCCLQLEQAEERRRQKAGQASEQPPRDAKDEPAQRETDPRGAVPIGDREVDEGTPVADPSRNR
jgi:hypothetical protein